MNARLVLLAIAACERAPTHATGKIGYVPVRIGSTLDMTHTHVMAFARAPGDAHLALRRQTMTSQVTAMRDDRVTALAVEISEDDHIVDGAPSEPDTGRYTLEMRDGALVIAKDHGTLTRAQRDYFREFEAAFDPPAAYRAFVEHEFSVGESYVVPLDQRRALGFVEARRVELVVDDVLDDAVRFRATIDSTHQPDATGFVGSRASMSMTFGVRHRDEDGVAEILGRDGPAGTMRFVTVTRSSP